MPCRVYREQKCQGSLVEKLVLRLFAILVHGVSDGRKIAILFVTFVVKLEQTGYLRLLKVVGQHYLEEMDVELMGFGFGEVEFQRGPILGIWWA